MNNIDVVEVSIWLKIFKIHPKIYKKIEKIATRQSRGGVGPRECYPSY